MAVAESSGWIVTRKLAVSIPRFALTPPEAAAAIGVGPDFFEENVAPELRLIRRGRKRLVPVSELERWVAQAASAPMVEQVGHAPRGMSADRATLTSKST
jgi:hypothetical protein